VQEEEAWEGRRCLAPYWLDLASDLGLASLTLLHHLHLWALKCGRHGLQPQLADGMLLLEVRMLAGFLRARLRRHAACRRMLRALRTACRDAGADQLARGPCCICLEGMKVGGHCLDRACSSCVGLLCDLPCRPGPWCGTKPLACCLARVQAGKLLPCGHVLHASCLGAWLQQNAAGTCPLCRASLDVGLAQCKLEQQAAEQTGPSCAQGSTLRPAAELGGAAAAEAALGFHSVLNESRASRRPFTRSQAHLATAAGSEAGAAAPAARVTRQRRRASSAVV
jgi:hypothetical protein